MEDNYVIRGVLCVAEDINLKFTMSWKGEFSTASEVRLFSRGVKKMLDSYLITNGFEGYEFSTFKGNVEENIVVDKVIYHKKKGEIAEDSAE